jgi:hypothetical protein
MNNLKKSPSYLNSDNIFKDIYNPNDKSLSTSSFLDSKIGNKIVKTNIDAITEHFSYYDGTVLLKTIKIVYAASDKKDLVSVERIA